MLVHYRVHLHSSLAMEAVKATYIFNDLRDLGIAKMFNQSTNSLQELAVITFHRGVSAGYSNGQVTSKTPEFFGAFFRSEQNTVLRIFLWYVYLPTYSLCLDVCQ